jgi:hypothetical protein
MIYSDLWTTEYITDALREGRYRIHAADIAANSERLINHVNEFTLCRDPTQNSVAVEGHAAIASIQFRNRYQRHSRSVCDTIQSLAELEEETLNPRFGFALDHLTASDWTRFEQLCSEFLAPEWPEIRTVASPSGDRGRDATLFSPTGENRTMIQYSVAKDWKDKINDTVKLIAKNFPDATFLVFMSNKSIGAQADEISKEIRQKHGIIIDVRDRGWFLERADLDPYRAELLEQLSRIIADPILSDQNLIEGRSLALSTAEARSALIHLALQWEDDTREKGLTRLCFEALVKAALRNTSPENRMTRSTVKATIRSFLPTHAPDQVDRLSNATLERLKKRSVTFWGKEDLFCLSYDERTRIAESLAKFDQEDQILNEEIQEFIPKYSEAYGDHSIEEGAHLRIRRVLEKFLLANGELFANAVVTGEFHSIRETDLRSIIIRDSQENPLDKVHLSTLDLVEQIIENILMRPSVSLRQSLRRLADAYTLMAFLQETPDVQSAVVKMFSRGNIWLDTSAVLPLLTRDLYLEETEKFIVIVRAATEAGLKLYITPGILEEIERHINVCLSFNRAVSAWQGRVPFLAAAYALSGHPRSEFGSWVEQFCGIVRPEDDIAAYLSEIYSIQVQNLESDVRRADSDLTYAAERRWYDIHMRSRAVQF